MTFTSLIFLFIFFPLCIAGYYITLAVGNKWIKAVRLENIFLVIASLGFYAWANLNGAVLLLVYVAVVWIMGTWIEKAERKKAGALSAAVSLVTLVLIYYKYYNFGIENVNYLFGTEFAFSEIAAPLGISFITFSAISYLADIYRGGAKAGSILEAAVYLTFFPKVVSGPIVQWKDFHSQTIMRKTTADSFLYGLNRIMIGFGKKLILADTFGAAVSDIVWYGEGIDQPTTWICAFFYMLQIYYDFSGYSDIAIGLSALFGFRVKENFCFPYISRSISEFWRRWHISLGTWFREYIYIPLGGNRKGNVRTLGNLFFVFLVTGLWHGAGWNYILWGMLNGACVVGERLLRDRKWYQRIPGIIKWLVTMFIIYISWILFRITSVHEIGEYFLKMLGIVRAEAVSFTWQHFLTLKMAVLSVIAVLGSTVLSGGIFKELDRKIERTKAGVLIKEAALFLLMAAAVVFMVNSSYSPFIYFQY